jgi:hypothetical protein
MMEAMVKQDQEVTVGQGRCRFERLAMIRDLTPREQGRTSPN